MYKLANIA